MKIRPATRRDVPRILELVRKLAEFEKLKPPDAAARRRYVEHGFGKRPYFRALVLLEGKTMIGYAFYFFTYSTFLARPTLYLEDLFILPGHRCRGAGRRAMKALAAAARRRGCGRMEWCVLDWNRRAIRFYRRLGARHLKEWLFYRLDRTGIKELADGRA
jgi:GNAT superfamily N-acetyltransferase